MYFRYQIRAAVTWRIISELITRHHTKRLRVFETHPGGGQYDCLSLVCDKGRTPVHLCDFNIQSQHLHVFGPYSQPHADLEDMRWPDGNDYVALYLMKENPDEAISQIEDVLGLPKKASQKITTYVITLRLITALLERFMLSEDVLEVRSGFIDSSGYDSGVRKELYEIPEIAKKLSKHEQYSKELMEFSRRFWLLSRRYAEGEDCKRLIIDTKAKPYFFHDRKPVYFWSLCETPENIDSAIEIMYEELGGTPRRRKCPKCKSYEVIPIIHGYPTEEAQRMAEEGRALLAGCEVWEGMPLWQCKNCGHEWR